MQDRIEYRSKGLSSEEELREMLRIPAKEKMVLTAPTAQDVSKSPAMSGQDMALRRSARVREVFEGARELDL
jgi:hypothetical protein